MGVLHSEVCVCVGGGGKHTVGVQEGPIVLTAVINNQLTSETNMLSKIHLSKLREEAKKSLHSAHVSLFCSGVLD